MKIRVWGKTHELISYAVDHHGYLRLSLRSIDGQEREKITTRWTKMQVLTVLDELADI